MALYGGLLLAVLLPAFISLGLWQWNKAERKTAIQAELDLRSHDAAIAMPISGIDVESLRHHRVRLRGSYDAAHQVLIDNRLYQEQAGYHVITPLRLSGSGTLVLVNRGWLAAPADHQQLPPAAVPVGEIELTGIVVVPPQRFFNLAPQASSGWEPVWQNLDLARFHELLAAPVPALVVQLDPDAPGGYVRDWPRPDERAERHRSYALQWFGFALASLGIWIYFLVRRP